jgi:hypothetical protein
LLMMTCVLPFLVSLFHPRSLISMNGSMISDLFEGKPQRRTMNNLNKLRGLRKSAESMIHEASPCL